MTIEFDLKESRLLGIDGHLQFPEDDKVIRKLAMLIEGECGGKSATEAAKKFGFSRQRYYQLREQCAQTGAASLADRKRGPKSNYRRTEETVRRIIRHRCPRCRRLPRGHRPEAASRTSDDLHPQR